MCKTFIVCLLSLLTFTSHADVVFVPTERILLSSDLIVIAKIRSGTEGSFGAEIIDVHHDEKFGLHCGQYVKIQNFQRRGCNTPFDITSYDTLLLALTKTPDSWRITNRQYIQRVKNNRCQLVKQCNQTNYTIAECKMEVTSLFSGFELNEKDRVVPQVSVSEWENEARPRWTSYLMYRSHGVLNSNKKSGFVCGSEIEEPEPMNVQPIDDRNKIYDFCEISPNPLNETKQLLDTISGLLLEAFPEMQALQQPRIRFIVSFVSELDSSVTVTDIPRSGYPKANEYLTELSDSILRFEPGSVSGREKNRCKSHFPLDVIF